MRRFLLVPFIFMVLAMATNHSWFAAAVSPAKEMSVVSIPDKTKLLKTVLQGKYIFVHDDEKMAQGGPCFSCISTARTSRANRRRALTNWSYRFTANRFNEKGRIISC